MCCLFGVIDRNHFFSGNRLSKIIQALAVAAECRGTDATGIAYNKAKHLCVYKRPAPAHALRFCIPDRTSVVMGHTRMATQGDQHDNHNNHPFLGKVDSGPYDLAHNGVIWNDVELRKMRYLPETEI